MPLSAGGRRCKRVQVDKCQILALLGREGFFRATHPGHPIQLFVRASIDEEAPMNVRYRVELSQTERAELAALLSGDKRSARKLKRAQILLAADGGASDPGPTHRHAGAPYIRDRHLGTAAQCFRSPYQMDVHS